jgi:hypothetical protein
MHIYTHTCIYTHTHAYSSSRCWTRTKMTLTHRRTRRTGMPRMPTLWATSPLEVYTHTYTYTHTLTYTYTHTLSALWATSGLEEQTHTHIPPPAPPLSLPFSLCLSLSLSLTVTATFSHILSYGDRLARTRARSLSRARTHTVTDMRAIIQSQESGSAGGGLACVDLLNRMWDCRTKRRVTAKQVRV